MGKLGSRGPDRPAIYERIIDDADTAHAAHLTSLEETGRLMRRRKPTRQESLIVADTFGAPLPVQHLRNLTQDERSRLGRNRQLERRRNWERQMFYRAITTQWTAACTMDPKHLTT